MPGAKRSVRLGDQFLREVADLLLRKVKDPRVQGATLTGVEMSGDLKQARIFYSVLGGEKEIAQAQKGLDSAKGFIKREVGLRMSLRYMPEIVFKHDATLQKGAEMEALLEKLRKDAPDSGNEE